MSHCSPIHAGGGLPASKGGSDRLLRPPGRGRAGGGRGPETETTASLASLAASPAVVRRRRSRHRGAKEEEEERGRAGSQIGEGAEKKRGEGEGGLICQTSKGEEEGEVGTVRRVLGNSGKTDKGTGKNI